MEARDGPGRIRPLPPVEPDAAAAGPTEPPPGDRRWVPLAVAGAALAFFAVLAGSFGTGPPPGDDGAAAGETDGTSPSLGATPPPSTTTTQPPPTLEQLVPDLDRGLVLVYRATDEALLGQVTWNRSAASPGTQLLTGAAATTAVFDSSHRGLLSFTKGQKTTLWVGRPPVAEPVFVDVSGAAWHSSTALRLAFVGRLPGADARHLFTATALANGGIADLVDLGPVPGGSRLVGWGDWGFVLSRLPNPTVRQWEVPDPDNPSGPPVTEALHVTLLLGPGGEVVRSVPATAHAVGPAGELVLQPTTAAYEAAIGAGHAPDELGFVGEVATVIADPEEAEEVIGTASATVVVVGSDLGQMGITMRANATTRYLFVPGGDAVAAVGSGDGRLLVYVESFDGSTRRLTSVEEADVAVGFSRNGTYLIGHQLSTGDVVFLDWRRGIAGRVPFDLGRVLAVDV